MGRVTELRLAGATTTGEANVVLDDFVVRFNDRFRSTGTGAGGCLPSPGYTDVPWTRSSTSSTVAGWPGTTS